MNNRWKKRLKYNCMTGVFAASVLLVGMSASAVHVSLDGGEIMLSLADSTEEGAIVSEVTLQEFGLLGYIDETHLAIGMEDGIGYLTEESLMEALPDFTMPDLPKISDPQTTPEFTEADRIRKIQEGLIKLKYLEGTADGIFGNMSVDAVTRFQKEHNLEVTGNIGVRTSWLIDDLAGQSEILIFSTGEEGVKPEEKFSAIFNRTSADLSSYTDHNWKFSFDPFEQIGILDPGVTLGSLEQGSTDMDRMSMTVALKVRAVMDYMTEEYILLPAFEINYTGSLRPNINGAQFNVGNATAYLTECTSTSKLEGINVVETAYITIDEDGIALLKDENNKKGILRVLCQDQNLDIQVDLTDIWCREQIPEVIDDLTGGENSELWNN